MSRRAVITGIGVVAPIGIGTEVYWEAARQGRNGIQRIHSFDPSQYDSQLAGVIEDFNATDFIEQRLIVQTDRWTWMALAATKMALQDADFNPAGTDPFKMSVITASSSGGNEFGQKETQNLYSKGPLFVGAYQSIAWFYAATTGQISIKYGMKGPSSVIVSEGAGGLDALAHARRTIRRGVDIVVSGGTEAPISPYALICQMRNGHLSRQKDAHAAYRPFDVRANGYVPGEGGAILLVEDLEHAQQRGTPHIYGEILGHGATFDAYHYAEPAPDGYQITRAIALALKNASVRPEEVDAIFADGAGTLLGDALEAKAIKEVFGASSHVRVTTPKSMVGRLYAGGSSLDVATALLAMRDGILPPTIHLDHPAPDCDLNFVTGIAQEAEINTALVIARGFGGFNSALVLQKYRE